jgi:hypothetical protein
MLASFGTVELSEHNLGSRPLISEGARALKPVLLIAFLMAIITSIPQLHLWYVRGSEWNGACAYSDWDELAYVAYTNALIRGRPRRNDPFSGKDTGQFESLFSIQFLPAYSAAIPARLLGISSESAFMLILPIATIATFLVVWWLLFELTGNRQLAIVGAICVLSFGTAAAHSPLQIVQGVGTEYNPIPFLRRYIPALPFPLFLLSNLFIWRALMGHLVWAMCAALIFAILVYSYFFLWTALAAWFFTILLLWFLLRPKDRTRVWKVTGILSATGITALVPYAWLLMQRPQSMDSGQVMELRHTPDLFRAPELYGALIALLLIYHVRRKWKTYDDPRILFTASFALVPFVLFNQQIVTGRSLQPFHYEEFAANYWVVIAALLSLGLFRPNISRRIITYLGLGGIGVAVMLAMSTTRLMEGANIRFDEVRPVALRLEQKSSGVVFTSDGFLNHTVSSISSQPVLWARYLYTFSNVDSAEQKKRYYKYLYYSGIDENRFARLLQDNFTAQWEVFGPERVNPVLTASHRPITNEEIESAAREYGEFMRSFDSELATTPLLGYAVVSTNDDLSNIDRWYERDAGERVGEFVIYSLRLRDDR